MIEWQVNKKAPPYVGAFACINAKTILTIGISCHGADNLHPLAPEGDERAEKVKKILEQIGEVN